MADCTPLLTDASHLRIVLVHDYPPGVHAYEIEQAFKALGHSVFTVAMGGNRPGLDAPIQALHPGYGYDLLTTPDVHANDLIEAAGGADLLLYLEPGRPFLPANLEDCDIPTVGALSEEPIHSDWELPLYPALDVGLMCWHAVQRRYQARGMDHVWRWHYGAAPSFIHNAHGPRPDDFTFIGNLHPAIQRERNRVVERIGRLRGDGFQVRLTSGVWFAEYNAALNRAKTTYAGSVTRQINMRVFEAMAAGCLVIISTPNDPLDPLSHAFVPGREIVFADSEADVRAAVRRYSRDEDARAAVTAAAEGVVRERFQYTHVVERFVREIVPKIPTDYRERRRERLAQSGDGPASRRLNRARFCLGLGNPLAAGRTLDACPAEARDADWWLARGVAYGVAGERSAAVAALTAARERDPLNPVAVAGSAAAHAHRNVARGGVARAAGDRRRPGDASACRPRGDAPRCIGPLAPLWLRPPADRDRPGDDAPSARTGALGPPAGDPTLSTAQLRRRPARAPRTFGRRGAATPGGPGDHP
ncbi:MAG: glycosyltransferase [Actinobacteria bacterium]|nr:glycosyltransferase [Actinomycetota bacterium]